MRDGLQSVSQVMPLEGKQQWAEALLNAGFTDIEIGSIVPPTLLPQMADTIKLLDALHKIDTKNASLSVLVPNAKGVSIVLSHRPSKISIPFSCSEKHSLMNVKKNHTGMLNEVRAIIDLLKDAGNSAPQLEVGLSTAFGCTIEGEVPASRVLSLAEKMREIGVTEFGVADTVGYANPKTVKELMTSLRYHLGNDAVQSIHIHNTRGLGLANVLAAYEVGISTFDGSIAGLGGCPFAPGASGNIVTEDLVYLFESMGVTTGIDMEALFKIRGIVSKYLKGEPLYGFTPEAGLPLHFSST